MKNIKYIPLLFIALLFASCQEVIDVDLNTAPPRLVVDASINWAKGTAGNSQKIKLTTTADYYSTEIPTVSGAEVTITSSDNVEFIFTETTPNSGEYVCDYFAPVLNQSYVLTIVYNGETYTATETMKPVPVLDKIEQNNAGGFSGEDIEIKVYFTDDGATTDFYYFQFQPDYKTIPTLGVVDDELFQGNQIFGIYSDEDLKPGDHIEYKFSGISQRYFNYMSILLSLASGGGGGPFQSPPATVRGNLVNTTNEGNYALGYFSVSEMNSGDYIVQ